MQSIHYSPRMRAVSTLLCASFFLNGCAAILGGGTAQSVSINSSPDSGHFTIKSSSGLVMGEGDTPQTMSLPRKNEYQVEVSADGYKAQTVVITKSLNGWIWGNLLVGWLVGFIVDFASGAAYKLEPSQIQVSLRTAMIDENPESLYAVIRFFDDSKRLLEEKTVEMPPLDRTTLGVAGP